LHWKNKDIQIEHIEDRSLLAFQGPHSADILQNYVVGNLANLGFMEQIEIEIPKIQEKVILSRCGYTGEDGFEISVSNNNAVALMDVLLKNKGVLPAGLGSRDSLRLEAGLCLYGHDLNETITPIVASLKWLIGKRRKVQGGFRGYEIVKEQLANTPEMRRVGFVAELGPAIREGSKLYNNEEQEVGYVTSGTISPMLNKLIGMCYVPNTYKLGSKLRSKVRNTDISITLSKMPFIPAKYYKKQ